MPHLLALAFLIVPLCAKDSALCGNVNAEGASHCDPGGVVAGIRLGLLVLAFEITQPPASARRGPMLYPVHIPRVPSAGITSPDPRSPPLAVQDSSSIGLPSSSFVSPSLELASTSLGPFISRVAKPRDFEWPPSKADAQALTPSPACVRAVAADARAAATAPPPIQGRHR